MQVIIRCNSCGRELDIADSYTDPLGVMILKVYNCTNPLCYDCSECEEKEKVKELENRLLRIRQKIENLIERGRQ